MMKYIYSDEKAALNDLLILLGYANVSELSADSVSELTIARQRLGGLPGSDVVALIEKMKASGRVPLRPQRGVRVPPKESQSAGKELPARLRT